MKNVKIRTDGINKLVVLHDDIYITNELGVKLIDCVIDGQKICEISKSLEISTNDCLEFIIRFVIYGILQL